LARPLHFCHPWQPVELTARTVQGRHLLQPSPRLNALIVGILARAQETFEVHIYSFVFLSNHFHIQAAASTQAELSKFKCFIMSNIAREVGRLIGWTGPFWDRRCRTIPITDDAAFLERLRYILEHGCKEGLVSHPSHWKGLQVVEALTEGKPLDGIWVDRTGMFQANKRVGLEVDEKDFTTHQQLSLDVPPFWEDLPPSERQKRAAALVEEAALSFPESRWGNGLRVQPRSPHYRPRRVKRGYAPLCHASNRALRDAFREAYLSFVAAYRSAAEMLRQRLPELGFPAHALVLSMVVPETG